ncbi:MAG: hypothetical protein WDM92_00785 [Caulobacteraceae bacterium]
MREPTGALAAGLFLLLVATGVFGRWLAPYDPIAIDPWARLQAPTFAHPFGTDQLGRDLFSRVLDGTGTELALVAMSIRRRPWSRASCSACWPGTGRASWTAC